MSTIRAQLADALGAALPARKYRIVPGLGEQGKLAKPIIQLEQTDLEPSLGAQGLTAVTMRLHVVTSKEGITTAAEDEIDALGIEVFEVLLALSWANPQRAEKAIYGEKYLSYIITTEILTKRSS